MHINNSIAAMELTLSDSRDLLYLMIFICMYKDEDLWVFIFIAEFLFWFVGGFIWLFFSLLSLLFLGGVKFYNFFKS